MCSVHRKGFRWIEAFLLFSYTDKTLLLIRKFSKKESVCRQNIMYVNYNPAQWGMIGLDWRLSSRQLIDSQKQSVGHFLGIAPVALSISLALESYGEKPASEVKVCTRTQQRDGQFAINLRITDTTPTIN